MSTLDVLLDAKTYTVPKRFLFELLNRDRTLLDAKTYAVRSSVPAAVFQNFIDALNCQKRPVVTAENAGSLSLLAAEFFDSELASECAAFSGSVDPFRRLSDRVSKLERQVSALANQSRKFQEEFQCQDRGMENLVLAVDALREDRPVRAIRPLEEVALVPVIEPPEKAVLVPVIEPPEKRVPVPVIDPLEKVAAVPPVPERSVRQIEIPLENPAQLDGIISYLHAKHGGHLHEQAIVRVTSKSVDQDDPRYFPKSALDPNPATYFCSRNEPGQWICWDFRDRRVRPTHYAIRATGIKSWVLEGSLDGENWTEIDRQMDNLRFGGQKTVAFPLSTQTELRFIRYTLVKNNSDHPRLQLPNLDH
jgi:hypothetical protein